MGMATTHSEWKKQPSVPSLHLVSPQVISLSFFHRCVACPMSRFCFCFFLSNVNVFVCLCFAEAMSGSHPQRVRRSLLNLCLGVLGLHLEDLLEDLESLALILPPPMKVSKIFIAFFFLLFDVIMFAKGAMLVTR